MVHAVNAGALASPEAARYVAALACRLCRQVLTGRDPEVEGAWANTLGSNRCYKPPLTQGAFRVMPGCPSRRARKASGRRRRWQRHRLPAPNPPESPIEGTIVCDQTEIGHQVPALLAEMPRFRPLLPRSRRTYLPAAMPGRDRGENPERRNEDVIPYAPRQLTRCRHCTRPPPRARRWRCNQGVPVRTSKVSSWWFQEFV